MKEIKNKNKVKTELENKIKLDECFFVRSIENNMLYLHIRKNFKNRFERLRENDPCLFDTYMNEIIAYKLGCNIEDIELIKDYYDNTGYPDKYEVDLIVEFKKN